MNEMHVYAVLRQYCAVVTSYKKSLFVKTFSKAVGTNVVKVVINNSE